MPDDTSVKKIALVHDFFIAYGGAEKVFEALRELPYDKKLHTSVITRPLSYTNEVKTSFMQTLPFLKRLLTIYKFLLPYAFSSLTFDKGTQVIVSDTASFAKFIIPPPHAIHLSYIHTPPRFLWNLDASIKARSNMLFRFFFNLFAGTSQRIQDYFHAQRVHVLVANSKEVQERIQKYYKRESIVIYPPVEIAQITNAVNAAPITKNNKFLFFNRIEKYKNIDKLLEVWPDNYELTVAGAGGLLDELKESYKHKDNITFTGYVPENSKISLLASHQALIYPNREDFGIIMVEALAAGTPVIALAEGGAREIVTHQETGLLLKEFTKETVENALNWILKNQNLLEKDKLQKHVLKFDKERFIQEMKSTIELAYKNYGPTN